MLLARSGTLDVVVKPTSKITAMMRHHMLDRIMNITEI
jgi:head-tail adaptor